MISYVPIGLQLLAALALAFVILGLSTFLARRSHGSTDVSAYECGVDLFEPAGKRYTIRFYMVAMLFIIMGQRMVDVPTFSAGMAASVAWMGLILLVVANLVLGAKVLKR